MPIDKPMMKSVTEIGLDAVWLDSYQSADSTYSLFFTEKDLERELHEELLIAGFGNIGNWNSDGESLAEQYPISDDPVQITYNDFGFQWRLTHKIKRADLYNTTGATLVRNAAIATQQTIEQVAMNVFNNANSSTAVGGYDGLRLATTHTMLNGQTVSNYGGAAALTVATLRTALIAFKRTKNHRGQPVKVKPKYLLTTPENEFVAKEILNSQVVPYTGSNHSTDYENVTKDELTLVVSPYLITTGQWHILAEKEMQKLRLVWREKPSYETGNKTFDNKSISNSVNFAFGTGWIEHTGIYSANLG